MKDARSENESNQKGDPADSKFDFDFKWDHDPPDLISQFDLEVKWDDETEPGSTPKKVSLQNISMNNGNDIMGPLTQLITTVANHSFHERRNKLSSSEAPPPNNDYIENTQSVSMTGIWNGTGKKSACAWFIMI